MIYSKPGRKKLTLSFKNPSEEVMSFYQLSKQERIGIVSKIKGKLLDDFESERTVWLIQYFSDEDTYIRKSAYLNAGRIYFENKKLENRIIKALDDLFSNEEFKIRQTVVNAAGEIGKKDFKIVAHFFDKGLFDEHHSVRNAVIGCIKKMAEVNPQPVLSWAKKYLHHPDKEIRREICHGIELRGRKYPQDILPMLKELQHDKTARVRNTLIHVIGQIAYKKGCLAIVIKDLKSWDNKELVEKAIEEIIDVHYRYRNFSALTQEEARKFIEENY